MIVLGIESSCDDTSVALLDCSKSGCFIIQQFTASQIEIHKKYGGVVPEVAGRMHAEKIIPLIEEVLKDQPGPDVIAVTSGPGLITGLIVGVEAARTLSYAWKIPLVAVNHIDGHIRSVEIGNLKPNTSHLTPHITFPAITLVVSGGHTELIYMKKPGHHQIVGQTRDDAAGECFDKVAKLLNLPYPGGPQISKLAEAGRVDAIEFPRPMINDKNFDFSFSGLKTSALYWLRDNKLDNSPKSYKLKDISSEDFCASFEQAIVDVLVTKTIKAAEKYRPQTIILAGGVSANKKLRSTLENTIKTKLPNTSYLIPHTSLSMDNAAMIAVAGYYQATKKKFTDWKKIKVNPNLSL